MVFTAADARRNVGEMTLEEVYDLHARSMFRYACALLNCPEDAEDAVQEVFVRLAREHKRLARVKVLKPYLMTATRNAAYSILRSRQRGQALHEAVCSEPLIPRERSFDRKMLESESMREAFASLPIEQREVLLLKVFEEMTFREIAETTRVPLATVASRYRYGLDRLRHALEGEDNE